MKKNELKNLMNGEPCDHPGCSGHISHPCEACGRVACKKAYTPNAIYHDTKYLEFRFFAYSQTKVTSIWDVLSKNNKICLGWIKWHSSWRCYAFSPAKDTIFNVSCMQDIVNFINKLMDKRKI